MAKVEIHFGLKPILHFSYLSVLKDGAIQKAKIIITKTVQRTPTFGAAIQQKVSQVQRTAIFVCSFIIIVKNVSVRCTYV
jgi:hypothetical protein